MDKDQEKLERMKKALNLITQKAEQDGKITDEEKTILNSVKNNVEEYATYLEKALEDNIIDEKERNQLIDLEESIYAEAYFSAMNDNKLDGDEVLLLKTLIRSIDPKASVDWLDQDR